MEYSSEDNCYSINSPSFTDLVCIHALQQQSQSLSAAPVKHQGPEFEFSLAPNSFSQDLSKIATADKLVSMNQQQLCDLLGQTKQKSKEKKRPLSKEKYKTTSGHGDQKMRKQTKKKQSPSIGQKFVQLLSPCRECKTVPQTVEAH